jgi:hypothetical protein
MNFWCKANSSKKESLITKFIKETRKKLNECSPLLVLVVITSMIFFRRAFFKLIRLRLQFRMYANILFIKLILHKILRVLKSKHCKLYLKWIWRLELEQPAYVGARNPIKTMIFKNIYKKAGTRQFALFHYVILILTSEFFVPRK